MIITAQKGKANKIHISIDGEYKLTVDADFWFSCGYISGDEIDEEQYQCLADRIAKRRCFNRALNILSRRDHCEKELYNKLRSFIRNQMPTTAVSGTISGKLSIQRLYSRQGQETNYRDMVLLVSGMAPVIYLDENGKLV